MYFLCYNKSLLVLDLRGINKNNGYGAFAAGAPGLVIVIGIFRPALADAGSVLKQNKK
jgi:hypothetical protein